MEDLGVHRKCSGTSFEKPFTIYKNLDLEYGNNTISIRELDIERSRYALVRSDVEWDRNTLIGSDVGWDRNTLIGSDIEWGKKSLIESDLKWDKEAPVGANYTAEDWINLLSQSSREITRLPSVITAYILNNISYDEDSSKLENNKRSRSESAEEENNTSKRQKIDTHDDNDFSRGDYNDDKGKKVDKGKGIDTGVAEKDLNPEFNEYDFLRNEDENEAFDFATYQSKMIAGASNRPGESSHSNQLASNCPGESIRSKNLYSNCPGEWVYDLPKDLVLKKEDYDKYVAYHGFPSFMDFRLSENYRDLLKFWDLAYWDTPAEDFDDNTPPGQYLYLDLYRIKRKHGIVYMDLLRSTSPKVSNENLLDGNSIDSYKIFKQSNVDLKTFNLGSLWPEYIYLQAKFDFGIMKFRYMPILKSEIPYGLQSTHQLENMLNYINDRDSGYIRPINHDLIDTSSWDIIRMEV